MTSDSNRGIFNSLRNDLNFKTSTVIMLSQAEVYQRLVNFRAFEGRAVRAGFEVIRHHGNHHRDLGGAAQKSWTVIGPVRGKMQHAVVSINQLSAPESIWLHFKTDQISVRTELTLVPVRSNQTRCMVVFRVQPLTLKARIIATTAVFGKGRITRRIERRFAQFIAMLETEGMRKSA